jgi:hypothetical protein
MILGAATLRRRDRQTSPLGFGAILGGLVFEAIAAIRSQAGNTLFASVMLISLLAAWIATGRAWGC